MDGFTAIARWAGVGEARQTRPFTLGDACVAAAAGVGLLTIFLSSRYAEGFPLRAGPLLVHYPPGALAAFVITGILLMGAVAVQPSLFWPLIVGTAVITGGMFVLGSPIFDEWLAACLVVGAAVGAVWKRMPSRDPAERRAWVWMFVLWLAYLVAEGVRGLATYHNVKATRSILDSVVLLGAVALLARYRFPRPSRVWTTLILTACGAAYVGLYLLHGVVFPDLAYGRLIFEGIGGAGKAFATFPVAVAVPAALLLMQADSRPMRALGWCTVIVVWVLVILSASRSGIFVVTAGTLILACWRIKQALRLSVALAAVYVVLALVFQFWMGYLPAQYAKMLRAFHVIPQAAVSAKRSGTSRPVPAAGPVPAPAVPPASTVGLPLSLRKGAAVAVARGDTERQVLLRASVAAIAHKPVSLLFGVGTYGYWPKVGPAVRALRSDLHYRPSVPANGSSLAPGRGEPPRPPAWPVFLAETGVVGVLLILGNAAAAIWYAGAQRRRPLGWRSPEPDLGFVVAALLFLLGWGAFAELQSKVLFFLMAMPFGVTDTWGAPAEGESETCP